MVRSSAKRFAPRIRIWALPWHARCNSAGVLPAHHSLHFRVHTRVLLTLLIALFLVTAVALAEPAHRTLLREATEAVKANDLATATARMEQAARVAPDYPRVHFNLARLYTAQGRSDDAFRALRNLAGMGLVFAIEQDPAFTSLKDAPEFAALVAAFAANRAPIVPASADEAAWAITGVTGIIESVATHPETLENFFGDVHHRCIWYRDTSGPSAVLRRFSADTDGLDGVFALKFSADGRTLWTTTSALPQMAGYTEADKGRAALVAYDVATRRLLRSYPLPADGREHVLGDFALASDGSVYVTDSTTPAIWRLAPGGAALERWSADPSFVSLQGAAFSADGRALYVADYANGIWRIDPSSRQAVLLTAPAGSTLFGIDGLYSVPGVLLAVQNGVNPQRILRIGLDAHGEASSVRVLAQGLAAMKDPALGQVLNRRFHFVGDSGWELFDEPAAAPAPRAVTILSVPAE